MAKAMGCKDGACMKCHGAKLLVIGLLVIANQQWLNWNWWLFIGALLALLGLARMMWPHCPHCK